jgi:hypothetical protein
VSQTRMRGSGNVHGQSQSHSSRMPSKAGASRRLAASRETLHNTEHTHRCSRIAVSGASAYSRGAPAGVACLESTLSCREGRALAGNAVLRRPTPDQGLIHRPTRWRSLRRSSQYAPLACCGRWDKLARGHLSRGSRYVALYARLRRSFSLRSRIISHERLLLFGGRMIAR